MNDCVVALIAGAMVGENILYRQPGGSEFAALGLKGALEGGVDDHLNLGDRALGRVHPQRLGLQLLMHVRFIATDVQS